MKANEAPEKIWINSPQDLPCSSVNSNSIEYVHTNAFIEKAVAFLKERIILEDNSWYIEGQVTLKDKMIEDFRRYIRGE